MISTGLSRAGEERLRVGVSDLAVPGGGNKGNPGQISEARQNKAILRNILRKSCKFRGC